MLLPLSFDRSIAIADSLRTYFDFGSSFFYYFSFHLEGFEVISHRDIEESSGLTGTIRKDFEVSLSRDFGFWILNSSNSDFDE